MQITQGDFILVIEGRYIHKDVKVVAYDGDKQAILGYTEADADGVYPFPTHIINLANSQQVSVYTPAQYAELETAVQAQNDEALAEYMEMVGGKKAPIFDINKFNKPQ